MKSSKGSFKFHVITKPGLAGCAVLDVASQAVNQFSTFPPLHWTISHFNKDL